MAIFLIWAAGELDYQYRQTTESVAIKRLEGASRETKGSADWRPEQCNC